MMGLSRALELMAGALVQIESAFFGSTWNLVSEAGR